MAQGAMGDPGRRVRIVDVKVTPIAFRDPPLRNAAGVHEPYALRSIIEITASNGQTGLGEGYGDATSLMALEAVAPRLIGLEITDLNRLYLRQGKLKLVDMGRGMAWLDTGTHESMLEASQFVQIFEKRQGLKVACPEEIAWRQGWIGDSELERIAKPLSKSGYGQYLLRLLEQKG